MIYPTVLTVVMGLAITLLMTFAVPRFKSIYQGMKMKLPAPTVILIGAGDFLHSYWWALLAGVLALVTLFQYWKKTPKAQILLDRLKFKTPLLGTLTQRIAIARF